MKRPAIYPAAYRRGFNAAKNPPHFRQCPYTAGSVAAASWNRGVNEYDTGLPQLAAQIVHIEQQLNAATQEMRAKLKASDDLARRIAEEAYENSERHVSRIRELNAQIDAADKRGREAEEHRRFVEDTARMIDRARDRGDDVEIDRLIANLKRGW